MTTSPINIKYRVVQDVLDFEVATGTVFNEGDLMYFDPVTNTAKPISHISHAAYLLGDAQGTQPVTHTSPSSSFSKSVSIYVGDHTVKLTSKGSGTYNFGTPVYFNTDAQSFTEVSGSGAIAIGVAQGSPKERGVGSGTFVAGKSYEILLRRSWALKALDGALA